MKRVVWAALGVLFILNISNALAGNYKAEKKSSSAVDRTFIKEGDITGDGLPETISIHVMGESISSPFKWNVTIKDSRGKVIYTIDRDDTWLDAFFNESGFEDNCTDYISCKQRYYFEDIPKRIFLSLKQADLLPFLDEGFFKNLRDTATKYLQSQKKSPENIESAIVEMRQILTHAGYHYLVIPVSAVKDSSPMIWVPKVEQFVPYYEE
jgi:hypothetical protein